MSPAAADVATTPVPAVVVGASGYAGGELLRLLAAHPSIHVTSAIAHTSAGASVSSVHPHLRRAYAGWTLDPWSEATVESTELVFLALPHGESAAIAERLPAHVKVVDLGADFRLRSADKWAAYYGASIPHAGTWVYGLADLPGSAAEISVASRVANPGCYATAITLAIAPLVDAKLIDTTGIVAVAASGTSGAGRKAAVEYSGTEVMNSIHAYRVGGAHQHTPEIEQTLSTLAGADVRLSFTPLLAPMPRGIHATVSAPLASDIDTGEARAIVSDYYSLSPFVTVLGEGLQPRTADVLGTNDAHLQVEVDHHAHRIVVTSVIDNLAKGAASQAIHNANLMLGFSETDGLSGLAVAP